MNRTLVGVVAFLLAGAVSARANADDSDLQSLNCVTTRVEVEGPGPATKELEDALLVAIRSKLPRLPISANCLNALSLFGTVNASSSGPSLAVGLLQLQLFRRGVLNEVGRVTLVSVWTAGHQQWGPVPGAKRRMLAAVDEVVTRFAADYYRAGNP